MPGTDLDLLTSDDLQGFSAPSADHTISYGPDRLQFGELRLPKGDGPYPLLILIHGGCWLSEFDITHSRKLANGFASAGIAVWNIEYRRVGDEGGGWPGTFEDIAVGGDYVSELAKTFSLDLSRVIVAGHSAGGHLALWFANRPSRFRTGNEIALHGVLGLAPAPDLAHLHGSELCGSVIDTLMGGSPREFPERYAEGSGIDRMPSGIAQHIILGTHDESWTPQGERYVEAAKGREVPLSVTYAPLSGHFEMIDPDSSTWSLVLGAAKGLLSMDVDDPSA